jgi:hypothetical protein
LNIQGYVEKVQEYPSKYTWPNGKPKDSMWAMTVDNVRYSTRNTRPPAEGSYVTFEATQEGQYWNADPATIKMGPPNAAPAPVAPRMEVSTPRANPVATTQANNREASIHYQSSRKDALEFVKMMLSADLVDFGKAKGAQKTEVLEVYVDFYTKRFMEDVGRLAPPEHSSPVEATPPAEAQAIARPARAKRTPVVTEDEPFDDDIPFG